MKSFSTDKTSGTFSTKNISILDLMNTRRLKKILDRKLSYSSVIRQEFFPFQNNPKNLDPSYKMDLDLWDCLGRVQIAL